MGAAHAGIWHNPVSTLAHQHDLGREKEQVLIVRNSPAHPQPMFPDKNCM